MAFGGAGPVHAASLAEELEMPEVVVPPIPGAFSALGLVATDLRRDYARTLYAPLDALEPARIAAVLAAMEAEGLAMLEAAGVPRGTPVLQRQADCRYRRQAYELTVPMADGAVTPATLTALGRGLPRQARADLWPRQCGGAGAAGQPAADRARPAARAGPGAALAAGGGRGAAAAQVWFGGEAMDCDGAVARRPGRRARRSPGPR